MTRLFPIAAILFTSQFVRGSEFQYVSNRELGEELKERARDIERTEARIAEISASETALRAALKTAIADGKRTESIAVKRTRLYYRFAKQGGTLKYIFNSASVVEMLKRASFLQRLLKEGLDARRESGLRIAATAKQLETIQSEKSAALEMHAMLTQTFAELQCEMGQRRQAGRPPAR